jgi:hypothetical protein
LRRERLSVEILPILGEPSTAIEPGNGALDDPVFGQDHKSADLIGTFDDFNIEIKSGLEIPKSTIYGPRQK